MMKWSQTFWSHWYSVGDIGEQPTLSDGFLVLEITYNTSPCVIYIAIMSHSKECHTYSRGPWIMLMLTLEMSTVTQSASYKMPRTASYPSPHQAGWATYQSLCASRVLLPWWCSNLDGSPDGCSWWVVSCQRRWGTHWPSSCPDRSATGKEELPLVHNNQ